MRIFNFLWTTLFASTAMLPSCLVSARAECRLEQESSQSDIRELVKGASIERDLKGGEAHFYRVRLASGQYLRVVVDQRGVNVSVSVVAADQQRSVEVNNEDGAQEAERVSVVPPGSARGGEERGARSVQD
jgi:hypothetical protein